MISPEKDKLDIKNALVIILAILLTMFLQNKLGNNPKVAPVIKTTNEASNTKSSQKVISEPVKYKYLSLDIPENTVTFTATNANNEVMAQAFIFDETQENIELPFLLSNYDHILVINNLGAQGVAAAGSEFSELTYGTGELFEGNILEGHKQISSDGKIRATLNPNSEDVTLETTGIQIVAKDEETFYKLLKIAETTYSISDNPTYYSATQTILPNITAKTPNYTDPKHPYNYYIAPSFKPIDNPFQGYPNTYFQSQKEELMCVGFKEDKNDPCAFSTSGCTCCNTGCELLDYAVYASRDGNTFIEPILQKGTAENTPQGARFIYHAQHPWVSSAYYSSPTNSTNEVLDLINMLNSMEITY